MHAANRSIRQHGISPRLRVLIAAERDAKPVSELLAILEREHGGTEIVLSSITVIELEHGLHRARTAGQAAKRRAYLDTVYAAIPVEPFTREMAQLAAKIDADARQTGCTIPFADLMIGANPDLASNSHQGCCSKNAAGIEPQASVSSTLRWGSWQIDDRTAVGRILNDTTALDQQAWSPSCDMCIQMAKGST
jgi:tRNA(fMet)-specific endonuclease VapC